MVSVPSKSRNTSSDCAVDVLLQASSYVLWVTTRRWCGASCNFSFRITIDRQRERSCGLIYCIRALLGSPTSGECTSHVWGGNKLPNSYRFPSTVLSSRVQIRNIREYEACRNSREKTTRNPPFPQTKKNDPQFSCLESCRTDEPGLDIRTAMLLC